MNSTEREPASSKSPDGGPKTGWARYFGYDIFISFALGPKPRGCRAYASDLARRLRERGFTVYFSEDEAPAGSELDITLRRALRRSRILVVVANRGTLADPRWVRLEVEEYVGNRKQATVVPINVDGALQDPAFTDTTQKWLPFAGRIWVDEDAQACESGRVSDAVVERLATAPYAVRSVVRLRGAIGLALTGFALLATFALLQRDTAIDERNHAQQELLSSAAQQALLLSRDGRAHEGWDVLVNALAQAQPDVDGVLPKGFLEAALTSLVENRRGPTLDFDTTANAPEVREEGDVTPPTFAFDAHSNRVAVAAGSHLAVWTTADGHRLTQVELPIHAEQLTFAAGGAVLIAEGPEPLPKGHESDSDEPGADPEPRATQRAIAVDIANGKLTTLPLTLCEQWIPCLSDGNTTTHLLPMADLPATALVGWPRGKAFIATAEGQMRVRERSGEQFVLLTRGQDHNEEWLLLDRNSGIAAPLKVRLQQTEQSQANQYNLASAAPFIVASADYGKPYPNIVVHRIVTGASGPRLVEPHRFSAKQARATKDVRIDAKGTTLMYQNDVYGTGTGVGIGRTVELDIASGREVWARSEGNVVWGPTLVALQEDWADTQLLSAETGATWFVVPGVPIGFDPSGHMLLMWDMPDSEGNASPWPRVHLLETLPVRQFARDTRGPASDREACIPPNELRFSTLEERIDRIWNSNDWHRQATQSAMTKAPHAVSETVSVRLPASVEPLNGKTQVVFLEAEGSHWRLSDDSGDTEDLARAEVEQRYPLLGNALSSGKDIRASLSSSVDGRWNAVVMLIDDDQQHESTCNGWAQWRLYRGHDPNPVKSGCTTGGPSAPSQLPEIWFLPGDVGSTNSMLVAVPSDTCRYELLDLEQGTQLGYVIPAFGNVVKFERVAPDLLVIHSTDWYGATWAYQLQSLSSPGSGPVFMLADRNSGEEDETLTVRQSTVTDNQNRLYVPAAYSEGSDSKIGVTFSPGGDLLEITEDSQPTTIITVPPWGERLRERLRKAVQARLQEPIIKP
ncbi:toll/interleukin-1 receptor domain-containing protein [Pseudomonas serbica]